MVGNNNDGSFLQPSLANHRLCPNPVGRSERGGRTLYVLAQSSSTWTGKKAGTVPITALHVVVLESRVCAGKLGMQAGAE